MSLLAIVRVGTAIASVRRETSRVAEDLDSTRGTSTALAVAANALFCLWYSGGVEDSIVIYYDAG